MTGRRRALALMAVVGLGGALMVGRATWHSRSVEKSSTELASTLAQTQERLRHIEADKGPRDATPPARRPSPCSGRGSMGNRRPGAAPYRRHHPRHKRRWK